MIHKMISRVDVYNGGSVTTSKTYLKRSEAYLGSPLPIYPYHALHMRCLREHVHRLDPIQPVALLKQHPAVLRQGGRIARDVDESCRLRLGEREQQRALAAGARRVDHDDVGADAALHPFGQQLLGAPDEEAGVRRAARPGIVPGVVDRLGDKLDAAHLAGVRSEPEPDRAGAAVGVDDKLFAGQRGGFADGVVQLHRLLRIQLEEGAGGEGEADVAERLVQPLLAPQHGRFRAENERRSFSIQILRDGRHLRQLVADAADEPLAVRNTVRRGDQRELNLAGLPAYAGYDGADDALTGPFVVDGNVQLAKQLGDRLRDPVDRRVVYRAAGNVDELMCAGGIQARYDLLACAAELQLGFVPVAPGVVHAENRPDRGRFHSRVPPERFPHQLLLGTQLSLVRHMLKLAAAAAVVYGTGRLLAVRRSLLHLVQLGRDIARFDLRHRRLDDFLRQRPVDEDRLALVIADALAVNADPLDRHHDPVACPQILRRRGTACR